MLSIKALFNSEIVPVVFHFLTPIPLFPFCFNLPTIYTMKTCVSDPKGQVTQAFSDAVTYDYTYDAAHRVATITDSRGPQTLGYTYTPGGRLKKRTQTHQGAEVSRTDYVYDAVGRLSAMWAGSGEVITFVYDAGGAAHRTMAAEWREYAVCLPCG